ncbi:LacI family transcriptional regulator [Rathayibacter caricis DSM 15933]|uniref:LacI family transcriptional regulator n=1 Tax=Rathayibacter caricis DSM 15933 TaxID=1328867 RepID=A0A2T4UQQ7_9MICO|nr:LacI family DNA-binding transcriptional regulator [Rathayibacter caricis]PTL71869.1 LacI family transcriptional regulator [Rathayibacter caricis DSM 15933]
MATMRDVAERAGVSIATVSFVVNDSKPVTAETRQRVVDAMAALDYRPHALARALARRRSMILAVVFPLVRPRLLNTATLFFAGAAEAAAERGYSIVLWPSLDSSQRLAGLRADGLVDGVVLMEVALDDDRVDVLRDSGTPFALIGRTRDPSALDWVDIDIEGMVEQSLARLASLGHERVALVLGGPERVEGFGANARARETFRRVSGVRGLSGVLLEAEESARGGRALAAELGDVTAVLVFDGGIALGLAHELRHRGVGVPEDVSIVLLASTPDVADFGDPELDVLVSPAHELGRRGVEALLARLEDPAAPLVQERIGGEWRTGGSVAPAGRGSGPDRPRIDRG